MVIAIATTTRVAGNKKGNCTGSKKGNGYGNKEGNGDRWRQHQQWLPQREWWAFDGGNNGDGAKDTAGRSRYNWREGDDGGNGPWFVCVFWCVWRDHKK